MDKIKKAIRNLKLALLYISNSKVFRILPDRLYLKIKFYLKMDKKLNLKSPKTYNEKLQWLKIHDRKPEYTDLVDKYKVREIIADKLGKEYLIPLYGVYSSFDEIDFEKLPRQFVLKPNHTSGNVFICKDKSKIDFLALKNEINEWLEREYYWIHREWPYKNIKPKIICERFMVDESGTELKDYKFFCFNGEPKAMFIAVDRPHDTKFDFFDLEFNRLPFKQHYNNSTRKFVKPEGFNKMKELSKILSKNIPHVRVDFYNINGRIYFGEMTFYHFSGFEKFEPEEWDNKFGKWIDLGTTTKF